MLLMAYIYNNNINCLGSLDGITFLVKIPGSRCAALMALERHSSQPLHIIYSDVFVWIINACLHRSARSYTSSATNWYDMDCITWSPVGRILQAPIRAA